MAQPASSSSSSKGGDKSKSGTPTLDPMLLAAFGMDPKNPKLDPMVATALGLDPKNPKFDPVVLASMGLDPKNPNSTLLAAMAAMDPTGAGRRTTPSPRACRTSSTTTWRSSCRPASRSTPKRRRSLSRPPLRGDQPRQPPT